VHTAVLIPYRESEYTGELIDNLLHPLLHILYPEHIGKLIQLRATKPQPHVILLGFRRDLRQDVLQPGINAVLFDSHSLLLEGPPGVY
jgi:hypothetical protein